MSLEGKTILITGASRGIGAAAAKTCSEAGARVLMHASAPSDAAVETARVIGARPEDILYEDLSKPEAGFRLVEQALARAETLDGVVNNAGVYEASPLDGDRAAWREGWRLTLAVNVEAPADISRAVAAHMQTHAGGIIVNVASRAGHRGDGPDHGAYAASKGAVLAMTKTWARALAGEGVLFYAVAPGWVETRMAPEDIEARKRAVADIPLGRVAQPEEVAALIAFLLTGACASATGATFDINGASYVR
ncbi:MAG: SDR family oxidoreductase [Pseudomonadota bacterium]